MNLRRLIYYALIAIILMGCNQHHKADCIDDRHPEIYPDYVDVTFPPNIAPPNFMIREEGEAFQIELGCEGSTTDILINSKKPFAIIPQKAWTTLMKKSRGKNIFIRVSILKHNKWTQYADIKDSISMHSIDPYLAYRLLYPGYELWNEMGIYQRDLTTYEQVPIVENRDFGKQCVNCHTFNRNSAETMMLHIRGKQGGTLIYRDNQIKKVNPKPEDFGNGATYPSWHPSGKLIAFAMNDIQQFFHSSGQKTVEVSDLSADIMLYDVDSNKSFTDSLICDSKFMETFPTWTPDGKTLYFCRAKAWAKGISLDSVYYDLYRIQFDPELEKFHTLECVYEASAMHKSVSFPRISPDGKYLMFTLANYGNFSIWHPESDLYLLDINGGNTRNIEEVNSNNVESFHTWSSSGRWFVFSSKRLDGLWARPFFASFDPETGRVGKAFLLPQKYPDFYDTFTYTFNLPELIKEPVVNGEEFINAISQPTVQATVK